MKHSRLFAIVFSALAAVQAAAADQYDQDSTSMDAEDVQAAAPDSSAPSSGDRPRTVTESLPYTPYPAGLSWVLTPQSFRVPIPNRIYYPPHHYVRRCPYYPRGYYWGANWRFNVIGCGNLLFMGPYRYNPYLTAAKAKHDPELRGQRRYAMPPGPVGQAMLLGSSGPAAPAVPPTLAKDSETKGDEETETQVAVVSKAEKPSPTKTASSRRTAQKRDQDLR
jgi:hypothetical protein